MAQVGLTAALEQFHPREMITHAELAEAQGFRGLMAADHVQPWVPAQGQAPFVWNVLSSLAERTEGDLGPGVACPSFRMHPMLIAQASATLEAMYPGRHWLGLGSGEARPSQCLPGYIASSVADACAINMGCIRNDGHATPGPRSPSVRSARLDSTFHTNGAWPCAGTQGCT